MGDQQPRLDERRPVRQVEIATVLDATLGSKTATLLLICRVDVEHLGVELIDQPRALRHEVVPLIAQQAQFRAGVVALDPRQVRVFDEQQSRHGQGVGGIRLILGAATPPILRRPMGRDLADLLLALRQQELGEALAQRAAILDAPVPRGGQATRPRQRHEPRFWRIRDGQGVDGLSSRVQEHHGVAAFVGVDANVHRFPPSRVAPPTGSSHRNRAEATCLSRVENTLPSSLLRAGPEAGRRQLSDQQPGAIVVGVSPPPLP